jgi:phage terminase small subunit
MQPCKHHAVGSTKRAKKAAQFRARPRRKKQALKKAKAERCVATLDVQDALRVPLRDAQRERFCIALLDAPTACEAAIRAGYSPATARQQASRLLTRVDIQRRLAGLFEKTTHRSILRRRDVLRNASSRAAAMMGDITDLIGLPWEEFAAKIKSHPAARAIEFVERGVAYDPEGKQAPMVFVKKIKLFDPQRSERMLADLLGWDAPKKVELSGEAGYLVGRIMLPAPIPAPVGILPAPAAEGVADGGE